MGVTTQQGKCFHGSLSQLETIRRCKGPTTQQLGHVTAFAKLIQLGMVSTSRFPRAVVGNMGRIRLMLFQWTSCNHILYQEYTIIIHLFMPSWYFAVMGFLRQFRPQWQFHHIFLCTETESKNYISFSRHLQSRAACHDEICNTCGVPILRRQMGVFADERTSSILIGKSSENHQMMGYIYIDSPFHWGKSVNII